jgi:putative membrane protein
MQTTAHESAQTSATQSRSGGWPSWVYGTGSEPDYRFSFANERTFLAWIRTALALIAGGVALGALGPAAPGNQIRGLSIAFLVLGGSSAGAAWIRWARGERALRRGEPLPPSSLTVVLAGCVLVIAAAALLLGMLG